MKLEYPMNDALPNIEHTRDRLLAKVFDFRKNAPNREDATDEDYELLYAYGERPIPLLLPLVMSCSGWLTVMFFIALVTGQLAQDIVAVGQDIEQLYGVLNEDNLKLQ